MNEPQTSRWSTSDGDGTTGALSASTKPILHSLPALSSCDSFATKSACSCGWTAKPFGSTGASAHGALALSNDVPPRAQLDKPLACRFAAPPAALASVHCARLLHQLFHHLHIAGGVVPEVPSQAADLASYVCTLRCRSLLSGIFRQHAAQGTNQLHKQVPERSLASRRGPDPPLTKSCCSRVVGTSVRPCRRAASCAASNRVVPLPTVMFTASNCQVRSPQLPFLAGFAKLLLCRHSPSRCPR